MYGLRKKKLDPNSDEYKQDIPLNKTVAEVTGLSEKTVSRIVQQGKALNDNERFKSPRKPKQLMPNIPQNSVIVMDNAAYHSVREEKKPTMASTKPTMQEWLRRHNVPFDEKLRKDDLYKLIKSHFAEDIYKIDEVLKRNGHEVLRLPPYHPDLNPIELVWGDIKGQLAQKSIDSNLDQKKEILERLFAEYPKEKWENCVKHVIKIEDEYCKHDGALDEVVDFIINVQDDSDDSDDGCFESEESSSSDTDIMDISD
ncbi:uncharacterized protein LOC128675615 [Plodia interpunctella]|uniref:uncharacterized protein LOC128675615 n=1 Tax=Plodia interpunctella TaxID=58824 RepID=UPI0023688245|nr:uncharacterized protein LOC128675615 [Plodia interpunctella]